MKKKCDATGKSLFESRNDALVFIFIVKKRIKRLVDGRRRKHHMGKPALKRVYHCPHCGKYHITKWSLDEWMEKRKNKEKEYHELRLISFDQQILQQFRLLMEQRE